MKGEWAGAERTEEVRAAARGWKRAGAVGEGTLEEIFRRYPEPRTLPAPLWRLLFFVLSSFVLLAVFGAFALSVRPNASSAWVLCAVFGMAFIAIAELQARSPAMALRGGVEAASFWGVVLLIGGLFLLLEENLHLHEPEGPNLVLVGAALLSCVFRVALGNRPLRGAYRRRPLPSPRARTGRPAPLDRGRRRPERARGEVHGPAGVGALRTAPVPGGSSCAGSRPSTPP